jgi:colanic acid/amylovoran biosynthesis protein
MNKLCIFARDAWTVGYLKTEFNCTVKHSADLAFHDLPLQNDPVIEKYILDEYGLKKNNYFTIVVSGLVQEGYYCNNEQIYLLSHVKMIREILEKKELSNHNVLLLAHTFPPYGNESVLINKLYQLCPEKIKSHIIVVDKKILPTRARFIIGNGLFTITGRMHPAVSSFQMGKPAICLSYSKKYYGVIGQSIDKKDLIIEANNNCIWENGEIIHLVLEKVDYILENESYLHTSIKKNIDDCKELLEECLNEL